MRKEKEIADQLVNQDNYVAWLENNVIENLNSKQYEKCVTSLMKLIKLQQFICDFSWVLSEDMTIDSKLKISKDNKELVLQKNGRDIKVKEILDGLH